MKSASWLTVAVALAAGSSVSSSFKFDGSSSDMAQQFYNRYEAGQEVAALSLADIPSDIQTRLEKYSLAFGNLAPLLQRALLWDHGYVAAYGDDTKLSIIYTSCADAPTMADIALSLETYEAQGCTTRNCTDPWDNSTVTYRSYECTGTQMASVSLCAATDVGISLHSSMWATGGNDEMLPVPNVVRHNWTDSGVDYLIYGIHMVDPEHSYDSCPTEKTDSAMIIPCVASSSVTTTTKWCRPNTTSTVDSWLEMASANTTNSSAVSPTAATSSRPAPSLNGVLKIFVETASTYDGTSSDLALQYLTRYSKGDVVNALQLSTTKLPDEILNRLTELNLNFGDLDGFLQRALIWDHGYVQAAAHSDQLIKIYTKSGRTMAEIALTLAEYERQCTVNTCPDMNGMYSNRSQHCNGDQMSEMAHCASAYTDDTSASVSMWATGGIDIDIPEPRVFRQVWLDANKEYLIYPIHTGPSDNEPAWGACTAARGFYGAMIIPCRAYYTLNNTADWATPTTGPLVAAWLEQAQQDAKSSFKWWYILLIVLAVLLLVAAGLWWWCKKRRASSNQDHQLATLSPKGGVLERNYVGSEGYTEAASSMDRAFTSGSAGSHHERGSAWNAVRVLHEDPMLVGTRIPLEELQFNRVLAKGAFGEVWLGFHHQTPVAIKKLLSSKQQFECVQGFIEEIKLTSSLDHPNIIRFVGVAWSTLESLCMVMEYLVMGDLQSFLERNNQSLTWSKDKLPIALGAASAVSYLHSRQPAPLIHRDIKAKNMLLTQQLQPKLIDFGISRDSVQETMTAGVGTPYWAAPEVLDGNRYTEQSDIYSFGILLSELDTGDTPFKDMRSNDGVRLSAFQIINLVLAGRLVPELTPDCPTPVVMLIKECLHLDPTQRPTAAELVARLNNSISHSSVSKPVSYQTQGRATYGGVERMPRTYEEVYGR